MFAQTSGVLLLLTVLLVGSGAEASHVIFNNGVQKAVTPHTTITLTNTCSTTYYKSTYLAGSGEASIGGLTQAIREHGEIVRACEVYVQSNGSLSCNRPTATSKPMGYRATVENNNNTASISGIVLADCKTFSDHRR